MSDYRIWEMWVEASTLAKLNHAEANRHPRKSKVAKEWRNRARSARALRDWAKTRVGFLPPPDGGTRYQALASEVERAWLERKASR